MPIPFEHSAQSTQRPEGSVLVIPHYDVQWARPIFRAPKIQMPSGLLAEIPFTAMRVKDVPQRRTAS